jgi:hypothetical protein
MSWMNRTRAVRPAARFRPSADQLEPRQLLYATLGHDWVVAPGSTITYSFAPDGTNAGGTPSNLNAAMAARGLGQQQWQDQFRRAAGIWQSVAGINLVEVSDSGSPLGVPGKQQGDTRFGDIRIFGVPTGPGALAYAFLPPAANGGTRAGDMIIGTDQFWNINSTFDLQTVAIHEFGHSLGLDHSALASSVMYAGYNGVKQSLVSDDVAGMRAVYGPRTQDLFDNWINNQEASNATYLNGWLNSSGQTTLNRLDITSAGDNDWYYVQAPANASGTFKVTVQSTGLSSLSPRLQVYNAALQLAGWTMTENAATTYGGTVSLTFSGVTPGTGIYIRVMSWNGAASGPNGTGQYALQIDFTRLAPMAAARPTPTVVDEQPDQGGGFLADSFGIESNQAAWFDRRVPAVTHQEFLANFNNAAYSWQPRIAYTTPAREGEVLDFPEVEFGDMLALARGSSQANVRLAGLALLDTLARSPATAWLWEMAARADRRFLRNLARELAAQIRNDLQS